MDTQAEWEKAVDKLLLPMIDGVMNAVYRDSKRMDSTLDINYLKCCTEVLQKKTSAYIASKSNALIEYGSNTETLF